MKRLRVLIFCGLAALAMLAGAWAFATLRTIDGRNAAGWLVAAREAARTVSYHATGMTATGDASAHFTLDQSTGGAYTMRTLDEHGRQCVLGFDGTHAWYRSGDQSARLASEGAAEVPLHARARLLGTGTVAERPVVWVRAHSGAMVKEMAADRETGVILAMVTRVRGEEVSRMRVEHIAYQPVTVERCVMEDDSRLRAADAREIARILGGEALRPAWLPAGFAAQGTFADWCGCCGGEIVVLRYGDGLRALTLFELPTGRHCAEDAGCRMAPRGHALVESRRYGDITVIAVGEIERNTLARVLNSLQRADDRP